MADIRRENVAIARCEHNRDRGVAAPDTLRKLKDGGMTASEIIATLLKPRVAEHNTAIRQRRISGPVPEEVLAAGLAQIASDLLAGTALPD